MKKQNSSFRFAKRLNKNIVREGGIMSSTSRLFGLFL